MFVVLLRLFIAALWSPAGKELTSWLSFVMFNYVFCHFPMWFSNLGQVWNLIVAISDLCQLSYFLIHVTSGVGLFFALPHGAMGLSAACDCDIS